MLFLPLFLQFAHKTANLCVTVSTCVETIFSIDTDTFPNISKHVQRKFSRARYKYKVQMQCKYARYSPDNGNFHGKKSGQNFPASNLRRWLAVNEQVFFPRTIHVFVQNTTCKQHVVHMKFHLILQYTLHMCDRPAVIKFLVKPAFVRRPKDNLWINFYHENISTGCTFHSDFPLSTARRALFVVSNDSYKVLNYEKYA